MTIDVSSVPAFQDALLSQLQSRPNLVDVSVCVGPPSPGISQISKWIALLEVDGSEIWTAMGRLSREENYTQQVYISVVTRDGEGDARTGRDIAFGLRTELALMLVEDPTVNSSVWQAQLAKSQRFVPRLGISVPGPNGEATVDLSWREAAVYCDITVKNRMFGTR